MISFTLLFALPAANRPKSPEKSIESHRLDWNSHPDVKSHPLVSQKGPQRDLYDQMGTIHQRREKFDLWRLMQERQPIASDGIYRLTRTDQFSKGLDPNNNFHFQIMKSRLNTETYLNLQLKEDILTINKLELTASEKQKAIAAKLKGFETNLSDSLQLKAMLDLMTSQRRQEVLNNPEVLAIKDINSELMKLELNQINSVGQHQFKEQNVFSHFKGELVKFMAADAIIAQLFKSNK